VNENFIERYAKENNKNSFQSLNRKLGLIFAALFLIVILINTTGCTQKKDDSEELSVPESQESVTIGNDGIKAGIAGDIPGSGDKTVAVTIDGIGRVNPFVPDAGGFETMGDYISSDMIAPPDNITIDSDASNVINTKVTGILYDQYNPSAIINLDGSDYLVRSGDYIHNYKVLSIGKTNVTVQLGKNIYKAGVGELFATDGLNYNTVSNLESKFGGTKNRK
jgi:hypothetical protein